MTALPTVTRRWRTPSGNVFVIVVFGDDGMPRKIWMHSKAGTAAAATGDGLTSVVRDALRAGVSIGQIVRRLRGISYVESNTLAADHSNEWALSLPDALAKTLEELYLDGSEPWFLL